MRRRPRVGPDEMRAALLRCRGRVARAARDLGVSEMTATRLTERYGLRGFARWLRLAGGGAATGRPPRE